MHDFSTWSINLGCWGGVRLRLHALFLLFAVCTGYLSTRQSDENLIGFGFLALVILLVSVLLHEIGHVFAARLVGGNVREIVLGPFGGLAVVSVPHQPKKELFTALAGPVVNSLICLVLLPVLLLVGHESVLGLLNPLSPRAVTEGTTWVVGWKLAFWLNSVLLLVNLLPAFPFDGRQIFRSLAWSLSNYRTAVLVVSRMARWTALGICLFAWLSRNALATTLIPAWVPLVLIAIFLYFSANREMEQLGSSLAEETLRQEELSEHSSRLEPVNVAPSQQEVCRPLQRWRKERLAVKVEQAEQREEDEEVRMDAVLSRLREMGIDQLSAEDRALLDRVSTRYRARLKK